MNSKTTIIANEKCWMEHTALSQLDAVAGLPGILRAVGLPDLPKGTEDRLFPEYIGRHIYYSGENDAGTGVPEMLANPAGMGDNGSEQPVPDAALRKTQGQEQERARRIDRALERALEEGKEVYSTGGDFYLYTPAASANSSGSARRLVPELEALGIGAFVSDREIETSDGRVITPSPSGFTVLPDGTVAIGSHVRGNAKSLAGQALYKASKEGGTAAGFDAAIAGYLDETSPAYQKWHMRTLGTAEGEGDTFAEMLSGLAAAVSGDLNADYRSSDYASMFKDWDAVAYAWERMRDGEVMPAPTDGIARNDPYDETQGGKPPIFMSPKPPKKENKTEPARDFGVNDKEKAELFEMGKAGETLGYMADLYDRNTPLINGKEQVENTMKSLADIFALGDAQMRAVAHEMFQHFIDGNGEDYRNQALTEKVISHPSTQSFVAETVRTVQKYLNRSHGDLKALDSDVGFKNDLEEIKGPKFNTRSDLLNGLTICLNDTWGYTIDIADYQLDGRRYSGTIRYTVYDHFGLDEYDISGKNWYKGMTSPFAAWYVLQHYKGCEGKYKPFVTYMEFEVPFSGSID